MLAKSYQLLLKKCSLAQAMPGLHIPSHSKKLLHGTSLDPLAVNGRKLENDQGMGSNYLIIVLTKTWFGR